MKIIGRQSEIHLLTEVLNSPAPERIAFTLPVKFSRE
jgi:hypothetical protein